MTIKNGDTLSHDWPEDPSRPNEGVLFDAVVMNPPYSAKNWNRAGLKVSDPRFVVAGVLPPDSKGDFAFLLHGLFHLGQTGTMTIVLPHGVLFRGAAEGEIRKRLLEKNYIDTVIGLPSNLFTNTGIPVVILVLKKNRQLGDPILIIDASNQFIKVGKQNILQEKDIAKIVDTYVNRSEEKGYSHLADRQEIIENEYNLNIPRYIEAIDNEIAHDVDGHLLGGIPQHNINNLTVIQSITPDLLQAALQPLRPNYVKLNCEISELTDKILNDSRLVNLSAKLAQQAQAYIDKYWPQIIAINDQDKIHDLMEAMLAEIKILLTSFNNINIYDGYQIIAEIWQNSLLHDSEIIALSDFYTAGRSRVPNMVTKGTGDKKREVQDGFIGSIVPNELIASELYAEELAKIEHNKNQIQMLEGELNELIEASKEEDSAEYEALYESLKKNDDDEPLDAFDNKKLKEELKNTPKNSEQYKLLKKADKLISEKASLSKKVKADELALKDEIQERIIKLTDQEIDSLMYKKWFANTTTLLSELIEKPIKAELKILQMLNERYQDTLTSIDDEIKQLEDELQTMMQELVVTVFPCDSELKPKLRFNGFCSDWQIEKIDNVANRYNNLRIPITASNRIPGSTPYYGANGIQDYVKGFTHDGEYILVAEDGANDLLNYPVQHVKGKIWVNNHAHVLQGKVNICDNKFLMYAFKCINMEPYLVGGGRAKLNSDVMMNIIISAPDIKEQIKIGNFFKLLDKKIALEQRKLEKLNNIKQAYLNEMFV